MEPQKQNGLFNIPTGHLQMEAIYKVKEIMWWWLSNLGMNNDVKFVDFDTLNLI